MGRSVIVAVRTALVDALNILPAFADIDVLYAYDSKEPRRESVYTREARFSHAPASMRSGRNFRDEVGRFELAILVEVVGGNILDAWDRAMELGQAVEEYAADNKQGIGGAYTLLVDGEGSLSEMAADSSSFAELVLPIRFNARLT